MRILLTGSKGQVGHCFKDRLPEHWELIASDSKTLNITDKHSVLNMVRTFEPDVIINAAAYTQVDQAEIEKDKVFAINATGVLNLAEAAKAIGARLIHFSTDMVFDGSQTTAISESAVPNPINTYGKSKLAGELLALNVHVNTLIIRTSWVYSEYGHNFVKSILQKAQQQTKIKVVSDQTGCPTYAGDLANVLIQLIQLQPQRRGLLHCSGHQPQNWAEFAQKIISIAAQYNNQYANILIEPITTAEYGAIAQRPVYAVLNNQSLESLIKQPIINTPLNQIIAKLLKQ